MQDLKALPPHDTTSELADAMALAARTAGPKGGLILFVVQPGEINSYDQQVCPLMLCSALQQLLNEVLLWITGRVASLRLPAGLHPVCWQAPCCQITCCA